MNKKGLCLFLASIFALSGCKFLDDFFGPQNDSSEKQEESAEPSNEEQQGGEEQQQGGEEQQQNPPVEKKHIGEFYGGVVKGNKYTGYEFSKSEEEITKPTTGIGELSIYAYNDFHGAVLETENEVGLKYLASFFKTKSKENNTLILDQGDTWQGSFESNYRYGAIVQDVLNYAGVSLRTVGNHDFDWGLEHLKDTNDRKLGDDYIPCLASNVFDYSNGVNGTTQQEDYGKEYATFVMDNGIKVGVVGTIGKSQITSISTQLVESICFTDHIEKTKEISDFLRTEKDCDIVIASVHEGSEDLYESNLTDISSVSHKRYVDLVLSGHKHYKQEYTVDGVKYVQWHSNGKSTGLVTLKYDFANNNVVDEDTTVNTYYPNYIKTYYPNIDSNINKMVDDYLALTSPITEEILSMNFTGNWDTTSLAYLMAEGIYYSVKNAGKTIDFAVTNYARDSFSGSTMTFGDLYKCFPFDNQVLLMDVSNGYAQKHIGWNQSYREDTTKVPQDGTPCRIAVIDYLGLHQNENRQFDKFSGATNIEILKDSNDEPLIYRDLLKEYLKSNPSKTFNAEDYTSDNPHFAVD